jgi:hypothetical protein
VTWTHGIDDDQNTMVWAGPHRSSHRRRNRDDSSGTGFQQRVIIAGPESPLSVPWGLGGKMASRIAQRVDPLAGPEYQLPFFPAT